jgi:septation ring formation regulator EzrA
MNKTFQDLKMEIETIKKAQRETTLELENLGKRSGVIDASITNRIQEIEERESQVQKILQKTLKQWSKKMQKAKKSKNLLTQSIQKIQDTMRRPNLRIIGKEEGEGS